jgi:hypothetical protein
MGDKKERIAQAVFQLTQDFAEAQLEGDAVLLQQNADNSSANGADKSEIVQE